jgi:pyrimidine-nucleoside phosphorylase
MKREEDSRRLAETMVETGKSMGKKMVALITDMDQALGRATGHANEVIECIDVLKGQGPAEVRELSIELAAWMFYLGEKTKSVDEGRNLAQSMIATGKAFEKFKECIRLQGGDERVMDNPQLLPAAKSSVEVNSVASGYIAGTRCEQFGQALAILGGGREKKEDHIDHAVGLEFHKRIGDRVEKGEPLATIHYNSDARLSEAQKLLTENFLIQSDRVEPRPLIRRIIGQ